MAYAPKDYIVLCLDVGPSMDIAPPSGGETHLEMAVRVANQIIQQKMFAGSKDYVGLVLFGTPDTDNELANDDDGYKNISVAFQPVQPTMDLLKYIHNHVAAGDTSADFIDAIVVSMDCLVKATASAKRVGEKKIYLLTDAGSEYSDDGLDNICSGLKEKNIELVVVGPSLDSPGDGMGGGGGGDSPGDGPGPSRRRPPVSSSVMKKTAQQIAGESVLSRVVEEVEGVNFSFSEALQVATFIRKNAKKQTTRFSGSLEIGSNLKIPVKIFTKTMEERPATWKKLSAISQASANPGSMAVKFHRSYHRKDDDETEVEMENVAKGYRYGKSLIPISDADEDAMKLGAERGLSLLGFTNTKNIKFNQITGNSVLCVVADPSNEEAGQALSAFIHGMYETETAMVLRYVWRKNSQPKLMAAVPKIKNDIECLYMFQLPFMEDTRQYVFAPLPGKNEPSGEQLDAMDSFISNMDLMSADVDEDGEPCEAVKPKRMCNPLIQRTYQCIAHRALHPSDPLPEVDTNIVKMLGPSEALLDKSKDDIKRLKEIFPLQKIEKKKDGDGGAAEAWKKTSELDLDAEAPPSKRPRTDNDDTDFSMASLARGEVTQVGTLDPVSDYRNLIGRKDVDKFDDASKQMQEVTLRLVKESFGDTYYDKALDCVKALRSEAIGHSKSEMFNKFLRDMKSEFIGTRYAAFWDKVVGETVSLVTSSESGDSSVTQEEVKQFLEASMEVAEPSPPPQEETDDADDLLAMM